MTKLETYLPEVSAVLADRLSIDVTDPDLDLIDSGLVNSLGFISLFVELEARFGVVVQLDDMDLDNFRTPRLIDRFVSSRIEA